MQLLVYIIVYPFLWIISILPFRMLYMLSDLLSFVLYRVLGYRRTVVRENIKIAFPDKSKSERREIESGFYTHLGDMIVEGIKSLSISKKEMLSRMTFSNIEQVQALEDQNKPIALMCAHYGSWEWIFIMQDYFNKKGYAVYKKLRNKYFDALFKRTRAQYDTYLITTKETFPVLIKAQSDNELTICGFVSDQSPKLHKAIHWDYFMGVKVPVHVGAEVLAKRLDMAVVYFKVDRIKRGYYRTTFQTITETPREYANYDITSKFLKLVEIQIKKAPEYYLWSHKRWKHKDQVPEEFL